MPSPRTAADPRGLWLFVHLARIAAATADVDGLAHAGLRHDLRLLELESARERPRHDVALALVDAVVLGLHTVVSAPTLELLADARDDVRRPLPGLSPAAGGTGPAEVREAG